MPSAVCISAQLQGPGYLYLLHRSGRREDWKHKILRVKTESKEIIYSPTYKRRGYALLLKYTQVCRSVSETEEAVAPVGQGDGLRSAGIWAWPKLKQDIKVL